MDRKYVAMKLQTGEEILALLHDEDPNGVLILHPMMVQHETDEEHAIEHYWAQPLCPFTDDHSFFIEKKNVVYIKTLSPYLIKHYHAMVERFGESEIIKQARMHAENKVSWGGEEITEQEAKRRVEMIKTMRAARDDDTTIH